MAIYIRNEQGKLKHLDIPAYRGDSAYTVATKNGFEGTEKEWLSSLKASEELFVGNIEEAPASCAMVLDPEADNEYDGFFTDAKYDYMGNEHSRLKDVNDANVEHLLRRVNTMKYEGSSITATNTHAKQVSNVFLKGVTKYRDMDTGEFIDEFEEGRNLELVGGKTNKVLSETHIEAIGRGLIKMSGVYDSNIVKIDDANFNIVTTGFRWTGVKSSAYYTSNFGGEFGGLYVVEFDGKLIKGDISTAFGVQTSAWSGIQAGYNGTLPEDGKYRGVFQSLTNTSNNRSTNFSIYTTNSSSVNNPVEYQVKNLKVYCVKQKDEKYQSSYVNIPSSYQLYSIGDVADSIDIATGIYIKNIDIRPYEENDETNDEVITDMKNTVYKLDEPIITRLDLQGQKVYSYDGNTHYSCQSELGYPSPILSIEVPTDLSAMVQNERAINQQLQKDQNIIIESQLAMYEAMSISTLKDDAPQYIKDLYELAYQRGIRTREEESVDESTC